MLKYVARLSVFASFIALITVSCTTTPADTNTPEQRPNKGDAIELRFDTTVVDDNIPLD